MNILPHCELCTKAGVLFIPDEIFHSVMSHRIFDSWLVVARYTAQGRSLIFRVGGIKDCFYLTVDLQSYI